ncbi:uncharacterized protein K460DRAFT_354785 [Cucurbitaria berberidis CBS 394.84]|uniref:Uncharacterized protein n=1 Tax=Cucurbitaria berberidis CBS 394.84 TaxID=1168544 RepID=A0A9P4GG34_9PLEO|nr:uncharacterized protein K460DRAFT_354785 [Cucurbitaria berberidis CBS 394.84]KAF1844920.1 hypothetical protein K460DRAFT_354785 [Cucurbitaria berberidis CBS 394.84]
MALPAPETLDLLSWCEVHDHNRNTYTLLGPYFDYHGPFLDRGPPVLREDFKKFCRRYPIEDAVVHKCATELYTRPESNHGIKMNDQVLFTLDFRAEHNPQVADFLKQLTQPRFESLWVVRVRAIPQIEAGDLSLEDVFGKFVEYGEMKCAASGPFETFLTDQEAVARATELINKGDCPGKRVFHLKHINGSRVGGIMDLTTGLESLVAITQLIVGGQHALW